MGLGAARFLRKSTGSPERAAQAAAGIANAGCSELASRMCRGRAPVSFWRSRSISAAISAGLDPVTGCGEKTARSGRRPDREDLLSVGLGRAGGGERAQSVRGDVGDLVAAGDQDRGADGLRHQARRGEPGGPIVVLDEADRDGALDAPSRGEHGKGDAGGVRGGVGAGDAGGVLGREGGEAEVLCRRRLLLVDDDARRRSRLLVVATQRVDHEVGADADPAERHQDPCRQGEASSPVDGHRVNIPAPRGPPPPASRGSANRRVPGWRGVDCALAD